MQAKDFATLEVNRVIYSSRRPLSWSLSFKVLNPPEVPSSEASPQVNVRGELEIQTYETPRLYIRLEECANCSGMAQADFGVPKQRQNWSDFSK